MKWEYKEENFSCLSSKLVDKLNEFGKQGWEVFSIKRQLTPEVMRLNEILVDFEQSGADKALTVKRKYNDGFFDYTILMKKPIK